jgi:spore coat protein CotH
VRFKGNTSYSAYPGDKKSFKLDINEFVSGQRIHGVDKLNLNNAFHDPSFVREKVFYELAAEVGLAAPRANYAALYINDVYWGLYFLIEQVDEEFLVSRFGAGEAGNLWKGDPRGNLLWQGPNPVEYQDDYELESNEAANDWSQLIDLCNRLDNTPQSSLPAALNPVLDANSALAYLALCSVTVTLDSYLGRSHNLYYYRRDSDARFAIVPWDANESFGAFPVSFTVPQLERLPVEWVQAPVDSHPLAVRMWAEPGWAAIHRGHMRKLMNGGADPDRILARMNALRDLVRPYVLAT